MNFYIITFIMIKKNQTKYNAAFRILRPTPNFGKQFSPESDLHEILNRIKFKIANIVFHNYQ